MNKWYKDCGKKIIDNVIDAILVVTLPADRGEYGVECQDANSRETKQRGRAREGVDYQAQHTIEN